MFDTPAIMRLDINGELSLLINEFDQDLLLAIANDWEDDHLQKVLKSTFDVCTPMINQTQKFIFEIKVLNIFDVFPHNLQNLADIINSKNGIFKVIACVNLRGLDYFWS